MYAKQCRMTRLRRPDGCQSRVTAVQSPMSLPALTVFLGIRRCGRIAPRHHVLIPRRHGCHRSGVNMRRIVILRERLGFALCMLSFCHFPAPLHGHTSGQKLRRCLAQLDRHLGRGGVLILTEERHAAGHISVRDDRCSDDHIIRVTVGYRDLLRSLIGKRRKKKVD